MSDPEDREGGIFSNWSRRKLEAKRKKPDPVEEEPQDAGFEPVVTELDAEEGDAEVIAALPSLDEITAGFDIKPFLAKGVPPKLKNAALRRLWLASPSVRDYSDPAVDYAWDWNAPGGVPGGGGVLSAESVAKMVKDLIGGQSEAREEAVADAPLPPDQEADRTALAPEHDTEAKEDAPEPVAVRRTGQGRTLGTIAPEGLVESKAKQPEAERVVLAPARRHGGAVPE